MCVSDQSERVCGPNTPPIVNSLNLQESYLFVQFFLSSLLGRYFLLYSYIIMEL